MNSPSAINLQILVTGEAACFRRPEFVDDMISYDVIPPPAAHRLLASAYASPDGRWELDRILVLKPIRHRWSSIEGARGTKRALLLVDVAYLLTARFLVNRATGNDRDHVADALAQCSTAYLGLREFPATLSVVTGASPPSPLAGVSALDLGWMIYDNQGTGRTRARHFRPMLSHGEIDVSPDARGILVS